jgi:hypothetical protein
MPFDDDRAIARQDAALADFARLLLAVFLILAAIVATVYALTGGVDMPSELLALG